MSDRYTRVYHSTENLYVESSPIIIMARALLKDNVSNNILAQIKFKSISNNTIKAVKVKIIPLDTTDNLLDDAIEYTYLDLKVSRNQEFGSKELVSVPDITARAFNIAIQEVVFANNSVWEYNDKHYELLQMPVTLQEYLADKELVKQYTLDNGDNCKYVPQESKDLWICSCGMINHSDEECCYQCKCNFQLLQKGLILEELQKKCNIRIAKENDARKKTEIEMQKAKKKKLVISSVVGALLVAFFILGVVLNIVWGKVYKSAIQLEQETKWEECLKTYQQIPSFYKDTKQRKNRVEYVKEKNDEIGGRYVQTYTNDIKLKSRVTFDVSVYIENDEVMVKVNTMGLSAGKLEDNNTAWVEYKSGWKKEYDAKVLVKFSNGNLTITYHHNNGATQIDRAVKE